MSAQPLPAGPAARFGSVMASMMTVCHTTSGRFPSWKLRPVEPLSLHPAPHALHYGSACFEGLKADRGIDGLVRLFRLRDHPCAAVAGQRPAAVPSDPPGGVAGDDDAGDWPGRSRGGARRSRAALCAAHLDRCRCEHRCGSGRVEGSGAVRDREPRSASASTATAAWRCMWRRAFLVPPRSSNEAGANTRWRWR